MKRVFTLIILALTLTSCFKDQLREVHDQITELRDIKLATLSKQADEISGSIDKLDTLTVELKQYIESLEKFGSDITKNLQNVTVQIEKFKTSAGSQISSSQKDLIDLIDKMNNSVDGTYKDLNMLIESLKERDTAIEGQITSLKTYMDGLYATSDWADSTLATLKKQKEIQEEVEAIKTEVESFAESSRALKKKLIAEFEKSLDAFKKEFGEELASEIEKISKELNEALTLLEKEVTSKYSEDVRKAVDACNESLRSWVNNKLTEYYTVAAAEAQIKAFKLLIGNVPEGKNLQDEIDALQKDLEEAEKTITEQYTKAIAEAIEKYEGRISDEMDQRLQSIANDVLKPLSDKLPGIQEEINKLRAASAELKKRINTVSEQGQKISESIAVLTELNKTLEQYVNEIVKKLEDADDANRKDLEGKLDDLKKVIETLQKNISDLKAYVGTLPEGVETDVTTWIQTTFSTLDAQFDSYATITEVDAIVKAINGRINGHDTAIAALEKAIGELTGKLKTAVEGWVSDKLTAYTTAADADKLLETLESEVTELFTNGDKDIQKKIDDLKKALEDMEGRIEAGYKKLIEESIATEEGTILDDMKVEAGKINDDVAGLLSKAQGIEGDLDVLLKKVADIQAIADSQKTELETLQAFLKANDYESLYDVVTDIIGKIDGLADEYADKEELDNLYVYVTGELATESERIAGLVGRMMGVTTLVSKLSAFLDDTDMSGATLKDQLDEIIGKVETLEAEVNGDESNPSLTAQVEALEVALYGEDKDPENPSSDSICGMIDYLMKVLVTGSFTAITYIPRYIDHAEMLNYSPSEGVSTSFDFMVKPASIARFIDEEGYSDCFKMRFVKDGILYDFQSQEIRGSEDGIISVDVRDDRYNLLKSGASAALYVTSEDDALPSFTSKFIPLLDINGSAVLSSNLGILRFSPDAGSKPVVITATKLFYVESCPDWVTLPATDGRNIYGNYYNTCPDGKEFLITVDNNTTFNSRVGDVVLITKNTLGGTDNTLTIHVEQEGNKVLYSDIPAAGGVFQNSKYTFTLYNNDTNYPYIYLSDSGKVIGEEILEQIGVDAGTLELLKRLGLLDFDNDLIDLIGRPYLTVQYDDGSGNLKDFPTSALTAIKAKSIKITIDATYFYLLLTAMSDDNRITFTTVSSPILGRTGSSISFTITRYHTLLVNPHDQTIR